MNEEVEKLPEALRERALGELLRADTVGDGRELASAEAELEAVLKSAAGLIRLVVSTTSIITRSIGEGGVDESARRVLRDVAGEVSADNAEIGQESIVRFMHNYFSAPVAGDLLGHLLAVTPRREG